MSETNLDLKIKSSRELQVHVFTCISTMLIELIIQINESDIQYTKKQLFVALKANIKRLNLFIFWHLFLLLAFRNKNLSPFVRILTFAS